MPHVSLASPVDKTTGLSLFWRERLFEGSLILSMLLYYVVGNANLKIVFLSRLNPLLSLPFLLVFMILCWYRLPIAVALLPLSLPYYQSQYQKIVVSHYAFSLAEVTLGSCLVIALLQLFLQRRDRNPKLSWSELRHSIGPFAFPILVFFLAAALAITIAYSRATALRAFRQEILDPLLYLGLALIYLRTRQDVLRLLSALLGMGLVIAILGLVQYIFFKNTLVLEDGIRRVHAIYGSANSIGLLFDYVLPIGMALLLARVNWKLRLLSLAICIPLFFVLYLTQSRGAWLAIAVAILFIVLTSIRNRKILLISSLAGFVVLVILLVGLHTQIYNFIFQSHMDPQHISTVTKRFYLWQSALNMIHDSPWLGYGMDNWLCHYSKNFVCNSNLHFYWILNDPVTGYPTGLRDEPNLSHPHNIFLHVWVSMGIFGLLAFVAILFLFFWLFARILRHQYSAKTAANEQLRWMTVGVGASMLATLIQGMVDSAFLEQDLAFCFWMLIASLLLLRPLSGIPWRDIQKKESVQGTGIKQNTA